MNWSNVLDFHSQLIEFSSTYVQDCSKADRPLSVQDFLSHTQVMQDLEKEQMVLAEQEYQNL